MKLIPLTQGLFAKVDDEDYDWLIKWNWCASKASENVFYAQRVRMVGNKKTSISMHRAITGTLLPMVTDHKDGDGLNNQKLNLRIATFAQNQSNRRSFGFSKFLGVSYENDRRKWRGAICSNGIKFKSTRFNTEIEAAMWYNEKAKELHGEFANTNKI